MKVNTKDTYKNPIILCDYSDPDVIRVNDTYYMTASSFNFTPGLPVLASSNLVDWHLINYACKNIPLPQYDIPQNAKGLWAPSIRYHDGKYYIFVASPDDGIFVTEAADPYGAWSELRLIWTGKGFEDPCPLWDDDGKVYLVHGYVKSRIGFNSKLGLLELDPVTLNACSEDKFIFDGTQTQPTIEGPKFYKKDGWYYIMAPAGGVSEGWQTCLRSKSIEGPYEEKIVLSQGGTKVNGPHQGGLVQSPQGKWWFIHFQDKGIFGRVTHLQPAYFKDDWPVIGHKGEPVTEYEKPLDTGAVIKEAGPDSVRACKGCEMDWQWPANHKDSFACMTNFKEYAKSYLISEGEKSEDIKPMPDEGSILKIAVHNKTNGKAGFPVIWKSPHVLSQKLKYYNEYIDVIIEPQRVKEGVRAGVVFLGDEYASIAAERVNGVFRIVYLESYGSERGDDVRSEKIKTAFEIKNIDDYTLVSLHAIFTSDKKGSRVDFCYDLYNDLAEITESKPDEGLRFKTRNAHWVGGRLGVYAFGSNTNEEFFEFNRVKVDEYND